MYHRNPALVVVFIVCLVTWGCRRGTGPDHPTGTVRGTVTLEGQPLGEGDLNFYAGATGVGATATLRPDGTFEISQPIRTGSYVVYVTPPVPAPSAPGEPVRRPIDKNGPQLSIPKRYRTEATTPLKEEIKEGENSFTFDLTP